MAGSFVADVLLEESNEVRRRGGSVETAAPRAQAQQHQLPPRARPGSEGAPVRPRPQVLAVPVVRPRAAKKLLRELGPRQLLGPPLAPTTEDGLDAFLQHVGGLSGKNPGRWDRVGETQVEISEADGKRTIKRTSMCTGIQLHLWVTPPHYDARLPPRPGTPELDFSVQRREVKSTEEWRQLIADQPWTASRRRQLVLNFLQAKLEAEDGQLQLEGARGAWELAINKAHHAEMGAQHLRPLVQHLQSASIEVARTCAAAVWGLAVNERCRALLLGLGAVQALLGVARASLALPCVADPERHAAEYLAGGKCSQSQRNQLQACVLGGLSVLAVDAACRAPIVALEPGLDTLFALAGALEGYTDRAWAAARRETAAKAIASLVQRDADVRASLVATGGIGRLLALLDAKGPGSARVQFAMASVLATLVLDDGAMALIQGRGEGHLVFTATLRLLGHVVNALKFSLAVPGAQILSEGMTAADVAAAMQRLREGGDSSGGGGAAVAAARVSASGGDALLRTAARRLSQEAALGGGAGSGGAAAPALARRLSTDAAAAAALLQEASRASAAGGGTAGAAADEDDAPEPLDAANARPACWLASAATPPPRPPPPAVQDHVIELGKLALDCLLLSELDLGRVCHCLGATLASLASNNVAAGFIMAAPGDSVARAVLALLEVEDDPGFSSAGHVRAAASTCLAFLACHPLGARGDTCLSGPFRDRLLAVGALGALLRAALASSADDHCDAIIQQTAAAGAVGAPELAMYAALMTSNSNVQMVEYLMAGMWILLKHPSNREVLGRAFKVNPAASALTQGMVEKLQDTIDVADVNEAVRVRAGVGTAQHVAGRARVHARDRRPLFPPPNQAEKLAKGRPPGAPGVAADGSGASDGGDGSRPGSTGASTRGVGGLPAEASFGARAAEADSLEDKLQLVETKRRSVLFNSLAGGDGSAQATPRSLAGAGVGPAGAAGEAESGSGRVAALSEALRAERESASAAEAVRGVDRGLDRSLTNLDTQLGSEGLDQNWGLDVLVRVGETWLPKLADTHAVPRGQSMQGAAAPDGGDRDAREAAEARADVPLLKLFEFLTASLCLYVIDEAPPAASRRRGDARHKTLRGGAAHERGAQTPPPPTAAGPPTAASWWTVAAPVIDAGEELNPLLARTMHILLTLLRLRLPAAWKTLQLAVVMLWNSAAQSASVERHQVASGVCGALLDVANSRLWPPTLRDMAAGQLQFLIETHASLLALGADWAAQRAAAAAAAAATTQPRGGSDGGGKAGGGGGAPPRGADGGRCSPLPFDLAALLNPVRGGGGGGGGGRASHSAAPPPDPLAEAVAAAGAHPGLVPVLSSLVGLARTGHPLLQLSAARGVARLCFAGSLGAPSASALLGEVKATAAAVGALGAMVDLLREGATKFMVLEDGGALPPPPVLTHLVDRDCRIYERDVNDREGAQHSTHSMRGRPRGGRAESGEGARSVLELLTAALAALLNLSTWRANQPLLARRGLTVLLRANTSLYQAITARAAPAPGEVRLLDMLAATIQNLASHPDNRTPMYRAELSGSTALDRVLEGPASPEPADTAAALLASRLRGGGGGTVPRGRAGSLGPPQPQRCTSPALPGAAPAPTGGGGAAGVLGASLDSALGAAAVLRPKVVFPPISRGGAALGGGGTGGGDGLHPGSLQPAAGGQLSGGCGPPSPPAGGGAPPGLVGGQGFRPPALAPPGTAHGQRGGGARSAKSARSAAATSVAGVPGSPSGAPPDSREQFIIWLDSTFLELGDRALAFGATPSGPAHDRRSARRPLWDDRGDWLQPEPESATALQRLLCRPLKHLWQDSPEARARAGNARWSPAVSEYREAALRYPLQHAAEALLTTAAPDEACDAGGGMTLERPCTADRGRGRVAMTVLQPPAGGQAPWPQQQEPAATAQAAARGSAAPPRVALKVVLSPQRPRTIISFENRTFSSNGPGSRPTLTLFPHTEGAKVATRAVPRRAALRAPPARRLTPPRTAPRGTRAQVSEGLFTSYALPNGGAAFMYFNAGAAADEAEVAPVAPPPRPTTVPLALQQSMPLGDVLSVMARPPGRHSLTVSRPEAAGDAAAYGELRSDNLQLSITAQAITRSQTTTTEESISLVAPEAREPWALPSSIFKPRAKEADARAFYDGGAVRGRGHAPGGAPRGIGLAAARRAPRLRGSPLHAPGLPPRPVAGSPRRRQTMDRMFERDWARACAKEKFTSMLARENKGSAAGKPDKQAVAEVHDVLRRHYQAFYSIFVFYAQPFHMPLNAYSSLLDDAGIPDPDSLSVKRSDCDTIFIISNFQPDKASPDVAVNDEHAMMRFEFMECAVRLALAKYGKGQSTDDLATAVELLFERNLLPRAPPPALLVSNAFRSERLYTEEVDLLLKQHQGLLRALYSRYRLKPNGGGLRPKVLRLEGWLALMADARLVDSRFTLADAQLAFLWSRMAVVDEIKDFGRYTCLTFVDFLEALGRVADAKSLPTASDLDAVGYPSILEWALDKERLEGSNGNAAGGGGAPPSAGAAPPATDGAAGAAGAGAVPGLALPVGGVPDIFRSRPSARFGASSGRPLYAKLELLLDLVFRRLFWDPGQPETPFNADALLRLVKKADKDLGP
ncbi:hypothetical protein HT031_001262 [Scenedesmus sp. PABB004]|nr:hypothetical protein HT031_001262 [Scenedesmus sp. PABB004]